MKTNLFNGTAFHAGCFFAAVFLAACLILTLDVIRMCFLSAHGFPAWQMMAGGESSLCIDFVENYDRYYFLFLFSSERLVGTVVSLGVLAAILLYNRRYSRRIELGETVPCISPKKRNLLVLKTMIWVCAVGGCFEVICEVGILFRLWSICPKLFPLALNELAHIVVPAVSAKQNPVSGTVVKICCLLKSLVLSVTVFPALACATYRLREKMKRLYRE